MCERGLIFKKNCKPAACSFMKKVTHLQQFKYSANAGKLNILRNSLECLQMVFVSFFLSATTLQYKQLKTVLFFKWIL